jgi:hypothetical protein
MVTNISEEPEVEAGIFLQNVDKSLEDHTSSPL